MKFTIKQAVLVIALAGAFSTANATSLPEETASANVDIVGSFLVEPCLTLPSQISVIPVITALLAVPSTTPVVALIFIISSRTT